MRGDSDLVARCDELHSEILQVGVAVGRTRDRYAEIRVQLEGAHRRMEREVREVREALATGKLPPGSIGRCSVPQPSPAQPPPPVLDSGVVALLADKEQEIERLRAALREKQPEEQPNHKRPSQATTAPPPPQPQPVAEAPADPRTVPDPNSPLRRLHAQLQHMQQQSSSGKHDVGSLFLPSPPQHGRQQPGRVSPQRKDEPQHEQQQQLQSTLASSTPSQEQSSCKGLSGVPDQVQGSVPADDVREHEKGTEHQVLKDAEQTRTFLNSLMSGGSKQSPVSESQSHSAPSAPAQPSGTHGSGTRSTILQPLSSTLVSQRSVHPDGAHRGEPSVAAQIQALLQGTPAQSAPVEQLHQTVQHTAAHSAPPPGGVEKYAMPAPSGYLQGMRSDQSTSPRSSRSLQVPVLQIQPPRSPGASFDLRPQSSAHLSPVGSPTAKPAANADDTFGRPRSSSLSLNESTYRPHAPPPSTREQLSLAAIVRMGSSFTLGDTNNELFAPDSPVQRGREIGMGSGMALNFSVDSEKDATPASSTGSAA